MAEKQRKVIWPILAILGILGGGFVLIQSTAAEKAGGKVPTMPAGRGMDQNTNRMAFAPLLQTNGYAHRRTIIMDFTKLPVSFQDNFPVLVSGTYSYLAT